MKRGLRALLCAIALLCSTTTVPATAAEPPDIDQQWLQTSIATHRYEIQAGKLALERSGNGRLGALARTLVGHHTRALRTATALARRAEVRSSAPLTPLMRWHLHILRTLPGETFAREYAALMVADHAQSVVLAGMEVRFGRDDAVKRLADAEADMLGKHLRLARQTLRSV